jgi:molybdopterin synthase sulfur carrier subunit
MANDHSPLPRNDAAAGGAVTVHLPAVLIRLFPAAERDVGLNAATVDELVDGLDARWPGMRDCICDSTPAIRRHINVFVDGRRTVLDDLVAPGAEVYIFTAMSGG